ncbi:hypothetical protein [Hymenobacter sp.]|jgi:hypothetical protein|uniref:hypothetical protein n=1 Tax=Hymenobacter sp. TaxID=1898978 RepID=UPI002EDA8F02
MQPEDIDKLFRDRLEGHAPTPPAYLWDRLEEELQPAKKRPVLWLWAAAAAVALVLASGVLWLQLAPTAGVGSAPLATSTKPAPRSANQEQQLAVQPLKNSVKPVELQATPSPALTSTSSKAAAAAAPTARLRQQKGVRPEARQQITASTIQPSHTNKLLHSTPTPQAPKVMAAPEAVAATTPKTQPERSLPAVDAPALSRTPTTIALAATPTAPTGPIEVEVHRSNDATASTTAESSSRHSLGGILLRQARNAVRGERVSLAETGLPEAVTVQARVGNRTLTKVIQL